MPNEKMELNTNNPIENIEKIEKKVGNFLLTLLEQSSASRLGDFVMMVQDAETSKLIKEVYIDKEAHIVEVRKYPEDKKTSSVDIINAKDINSKEKDELESFIDRLLLP